MSNLKKNGLAFSLLVVLVLSVLVQLAMATIMTLTVHAGEEVTKPIHLVVEDRALIKFTVTGGESGNTLDFSISYPNGTMKMIQDNVGIVNYGFVCDEEGDYILHFSNTRWSEDKLVSLDYEVQHYILGIPQMLFLTIIIAVVCVAAVAVFVLMGKPR
jgi:hypothetical protein